MIPFTPHLAHESLSFFNCKDIDNWPKIHAETDEEIKIAIQINGKTRDILNVKKDLKENEINNLVEKNSKAKKFLQQGKVAKTIYVKNRIINYIMKNK